jgi:hypothetical protein
MRLAKLVSCALLLAAPLAGHAHPWRDIVPGQTPEAALVQKLGEPSARAKAGALLVYDGEQAPEGTKKVLFRVDSGGLVQDITAYVGQPLSNDEVLGTFGEPQKKGFIEDTFQKVWQYPSKGLDVYFGKDGLVIALRYTPGAKAAPTRAAAPAAKAPATTQASP